MTVSGEALPLAISDDSIFEKGRGKDKSWWYRSIEVDIEVLVRWDNQIYHTLTGDQSAQSITIFRYKTINRRSRKTFYTLDQSDYTQLYWKSLKSVRSIHR